MDEDQTPQGNARWIKTFGLDLEDKVHCDADGCVREGTHMSRLACCGTIVVACMTCLEHTQSGLVFMAASRQPAICRHCGVAWNPLEWMLPPKPL